MGTISRAVSTVLLALLSREHTEGSQAEDFWQYHDVGPCPNSCNIQLSMIVRLRAVMPTLHGTTLYERRVQETRNRFAFAMDKPTVGKGLTRLSEFKLKN
jgi:hypothetical protein